MHGCCRHLQLKTQCNRREVVAATGCRNRLQKPIAATITYSVGVTLSHDTWCVDCANVRLL